MTILTRALIALVLLLGVSPAFAAESILVDTIQDTTSTGSGNALDVEHFSSLGLKVTISDTATVTFKVSMDGVGTYSDLTCALIGDTTGAPVSSTTSSGEYQCNIAGMAKIQTPVTANTGTVTVLARATTGVLGKGGGGSGSSLGATATAAVPSAAEGASVTLSTDLAKALRILNAYLQFGENSTQNLMMIGAGQVQDFTLMTGVTTNSTSATQIVYGGAKTAMASVTGTGAQTATVAFYGDMTNTTTNGTFICAIILSGTTTAVGKCPDQFTDDWPYFHAVTTGVTGTSATVEAHIVVGATGGGRFSGSTVCYLTSAASTNATLCKAAGGRLMNIKVFNTTSTVYYLRLYNLAAAPTCSSATGFVETIPIGHNSGNVGGTVFINGAHGEGFDTGIGFCLTGGGSSTDNTNAATGIYLTLDYK